MFRRFGASSSIVTGTTWCFNLSPMNIRWSRQALVCLGLLAGCGRPATPPQPPASVPRSVQVIPVELRPFEQIITVVGSLAAREEAMIAAQVAGQIEQCRVELGDVVTNGQEMVLIDTSAYEARLKEAEANLDRTRAAADNAKRDLERTRQLQRDKIASISALEQAEAMATQTAADTKAFEAALAVTRLDLERSRVRAPFTGAVAARLASAGDYVGVGVPIVRLVQMDPLRLRLDVPERDAALMAVGQTVRVITEGDTNRVTGQLARLAPSIRDADRMLAVEADVPNPGHLRAGLFARAQIVIDPAQPALCVPAGAIVTFAGLEKVVLVKEGKAMERTVITGRREGNWVEIRSGLKKGDAVVTEPAGLRTGQPLTIDAKAR
jgi:HlyD family secretion protein